MDGATITANQWNELNQLYVSGVSLICLLGLSASNWPNNCKIGCYSYYHNKIKEVVDKVINCRFNNK